MKKIMKKISLLALAFVALPTVLVANNSDQMKVFDDAADSFVDAALELGGGLASKIIPVIILGLVIAGIFIVFRLVKRALSTAGGR